MSFDPDDNKWTTPARPCKHCGRRAWLDRDGVLRERKGGPKHVCSGVREKRWVYDRTTQAPARWHPRVLRHVHVAATG